MCNSISTKNQFCAIKPSRYNDPPERCSFQAKLAMSSERSPWCCHVKLSHSHSSSQMWSQRAQLFPLSTTPNQTQLHQVPYDYAVIKLRQLKEEFSPKALSSLAATHNGRCNATWWRVFPSDWRLIHPGSWIQLDHGGWSLCETTGETHRAEKSLPPTKATPELTRQYHIPDDRTLHVHTAQNRSGYLLFSRPPLSPA